MYSKDLRRSHGDAEHVLAANHERGTCENTANINQTWYMSSSSVGIVYICVQHRIRTIDRSPPPLSPCLYPRVPLRMSHSAQAVFVQGVKLAIVCREIQSKEHCMKRGVRTQCVRCFVSMHILRLPSGRCCLFTCTMYSNMSRPFPFSRRL